MKPKEERSDDHEDLESEMMWVKLRSDMDAAVMEEELTLSKFKRKFKENPLIPIGCLATTGAIAYGLYNTYIGNSKMANIMMRYRIGFQVFTFCAFLGGVALTANSSKAPDLDQFSLKSKDT